MPLANLLAMTKENIEKSSMTVRETVDQRLCQTHVNAHVTIQQSKDGCFIAILSQIHDVVAHMYLLPVISVSVAVLVHHTSVLSCFLTLSYCFKHCPTTAILAVLIPSCHVRSFLTP